MGRGRVKSLGVGVVALLFVFSWQGAVPAEYVAGRRYFTCRAAGSAYNTRITQKVCARIAAIYRKG
jgi:hypothetical protein